MRRIILIIIASLMFANIGFAEIIYERLETEKHEGGYIQKICIDGYLFIRTGLYDGGFRTTQFVQFFEERDGKSLPAKCKWK